ncbi:MAG: hypothetical protein A2X02_07765 [Bacteroidetes bacterium GWF2_29_10]|nr:MAG: hypothetical protein A2X02_07765 [Bacteroidetes bacterium GWF2_29_10]
MLKNLIFLFIITLLIQYGIFAQTNDFANWTGISIQKNITNRTSVELEEELRLKNNCTQINSFLSTISLNYKLTKCKDVSIAYRFSDKYKEEKYFSERHRLMFDYKYKYKIKPFVINYRTRIQSELQDYNSSDKGKIPDCIWRNKLEIKYNLKQYKPYATTELFFQINDPRNMESNKSFNQYRLSIGNEFKINNKHSFSIYIMLQKDINTQNPQKTITFGLKYAINNI